MPVTWSSWENRFIEAWVVRLHINLSGFVSATAAKPLRLDQCEAGWSNSGPPLQSFRSDMGSPSSVMGMGLFPATWKTCILFVEHGRKRTRRIALWEWDMTCKWLSRLMEIRPCFFCSFLAIGLYESGLLTTNRCCVLAGVLRRVEAVARVLFFDFFFERWPFYFRRGCIDSIPSTNQNFCWCYRNTSPNLQARSSGRCLITTRMAEAWGLRISSSASPRRLPRLPRT